MLTIAIFSCLIGLSVQAGLFFANNPKQPNMIDPMTWSKPSFCRGNQCPVFTVIDTNSAFETRYYEASEWVATNISTMIYAAEQRSAMFYKLFHYIDRNNSAGLKIAMTSPVVTEIKHGQGPDCESNFTMHFMMPFELQANPPAPLEAGVYIRKLPPFTVFVKQYSGFATDEIKRQKLEEFANDLQTANKNFDDRVYYTAGYDGPYTFSNRHNEIWVIAK